MSEDTNDRPATTPPPLVPPPVRAPETTSTATGSDEPIFVEPVTPTRRDDDDETPAESATVDSTADSTSESTDEHTAAPDDSAHETVAEPASHETVVEEPVVYETTAEPVAAEERASEPSYDETVAQPTAVAPVYAPTTTGEPAPPAQFQRGFTAPPVPPKKKGNRAVGSLIAVLSVILFAVLYAAVAAIIITVGAPGEPVGETITRFFVDRVFWLPSILYVVAFVIVVLLVNRANWWAHVFGSLFVGAVVYFGSIGGALLGDNVVLMTQSEALEQFAAYAANPFVIAAALVAREVALWTGSAISARGRRMKARNVSSREEFERASAEHRAEYERGYSPA